MNDLNGSYIFLSTSIPTPERLDPREYNAYEITNAVVAAGRAIFAANGKIVTASHPTIAPLLVEISEEFKDFEKSHIAIYQSEIYENLLPDATKKLQLKTDFYWTRRVDGETPDACEKSLELLRLDMLNSSRRYVAAIFVGGMDGIAREYEMLKLHQPATPAYVVAAPGGVAAKLHSSIEGPLAEELKSSKVYPTLFKHVIDDIQNRIEKK